MCVWWWWWGGWEGIKVKALKKKWIRWLGGGGRRGDLIWYILVWMAGWV